MVWLNGNNNFVKITHEMEIKFEQLEFRMIINKIVRLMTSLLKSLNKKYHFRVSQANNESRKIVCQ
jgi:hypothetical protein